MKKQLIIAFSMLLCSNLIAQEVGHYLYLNAGGGVHNLSSSPKDGSQKGGLGLTLDAGYGYFFNKHWGFQGGIGLQSFEPSATLNYTTEAPSVDTDGAPYLYRTFYNNWREKQQLLFLDIPLGFKFRLLLFKKINFLATAGMKMSIPLTATYKTTGGAIKTTGYYSQFNVVLEEMPRHGFDNLTDQMTGNVSIKSAFGAFADLGASYGLSEGIDLYAGGYFVQGLNNVTKSSGKLVYQQDGQYNGVMDSNQIDKANTTAVGLKVGLVWRFGTNKVVEETLSPSKK